MPMEAQMPGLSSDQLSRVMSTRELAVGLAETCAATAADPESLLILRACPKQCL